MNEKFLTLGTVQFGLPYGLKRHSELMDLNSVLELIHLAVQSGTDCFDTAQQYGVAEERLGEARARGILNKDSTVITKLDPFVTKETVCEKVKSSLRALKQERLQVLMLHRWEQRNSEIWFELEKLQAEGWICELGASVSTPEEAVEAAQDKKIKHLQIPYNILDWRWEKSLLPQCKKQRQDLTVYARSVFLQGILAAEAEFWPKVAGVDAPCYIQRLEDLSVQLHRGSRQELCVAFAQSRPWIDSLVVGVDSMEQLRENIHLYQLPSLDAEEFKKVNEALTPAPIGLLNPALWRADA